MNNRSDTGKEYMPQFENWAASVEGKLYYLEYIGWVVKKL